MAASDSFDFLTDQSTLWAVVLGALLATIGGFVATALERWLDRRERERNAALFFGEVLVTLQTILGFAENTKKVGDPYGPITMRMLQSLRREIDIYDRNRESLFALRDAELRARIQTLVIRMTIPLDNIIEGAPEIAGLKVLLKTIAPDDREELEARIAEFERRRELSFEFLQDTVAQLKPAIVLLEPLARQSFDRIDAIARS